MTKSELIEKIAKDAGIPNSKAKIAFEFMEYDWIGNQHWLDDRNANSFSKPKNLTWCRDMSIISSATVGLLKRVDPDPKNKDTITNWARGYWEALHPHSAGASYVNFMMEEGQDRIQSTYDENYARLKKVKEVYDLKIFFHITWILHDNLKERRNHLGVLL